MPHRASKILTLSFIFGMAALAAGIAWAEQSNQNHPSYYFDRQPFIHPKIIQALSTWLSDTGDQIVSINLYDSQGSNRFCCESDLKVRNPSDKKGSNPIVYFNEDNQEFGYQYIGKTESGIHLLYTYYWGGGSGVFKNVMLLTLIADYGVVYDEKNSIIMVNRPRLLIKKLGEIALGDRWSGNLKIDGNNLTIGKDEGWFSGIDSGGRFFEIPKDRVIKIDIFR